MALISLGEMTKGRNYYFFVSPIMKAEDRGHRLLIEIEGESGFYETNVILPDNYAMACELAKQYNESIGLAEIEVHKMVLESMIRSKLSKISTEEEAKKFQNEMAVAFFGREVSDNQCVSCGSDKVKPEDFKSEMNFRAFNIVHMCQECQDSLKFSPGKERGEK